MCTSRNIIEYWQFKHWFANSKAINKNGKPLVLFHGTWRNFKTFNVPTHGVYFTNHFQVAQTYGEVISAYLSIQQPLVLDFHGESDMGDDNNIEAEALYAKQEGFDSLIVYNSFDGESFLDQFVVFNSNQIRILQQD